MEWIKSLANKLIGLDTAPIIYFVEENEKYIGILTQFFNHLAKGAFNAVTSSLTVLEILVWPYSKRHYSLAEKYKEILVGSKHLVVMPVSIDISVEAAKLRAKYKIRTPDAIQIATAIHCGADMFLTNDLKLKKVKDIDIVVLDDLL
ncbi:MAG: PIN domain nuclease [Thermoplasmata archaeon]|nr:MAG: PIN domain nuclease [Thermoplasmata archaeon]